MNWQDPRTALKNAIIKSLIFLFFSKNLNNWFFLLYLFILLLNKSKICFIGLLIKNTPTAYDDPLVVLNLILFKSIIYLATYYFLKKKILREKKKMDKKKMSKNENWKKFGLDAGG